MAGCGGDDVAGSDIVIVEKKKGKETGSSLSAQLRVRRLKIHKIATNRPYKSECVIGLCRSFNVVSWCRKQCGKINNQIRE